ncbi:MAG TPA: 50S ribosomal protein L9 [Fimbriimonadaceae bacterium]|jgi:large subunit ribosomal protein L9
MKVILNQAVPKVGKEGQIVTVADGFARNFLFPRKLAVLAEKNQVAALERRHARLAAKGAETLTVAEKQKEKINGVTVKIEGKVGKDAGKLFGAITAQDVADALKAQHGFEIDRKKIGLVQAIKRLGTTEVELDLHQNVDAKISVVVYDPDAPEPVAEAAPVEEAAEEEPVAVEA